MLEKRAYVHYIKQPPTTCAFITNTLRARLYEVAAAPSGRPIVYVIDLSSTTDESIVAEIALGAIGQYGYVRSCGRAKPDHTHIHAL